MSKPIYVWIRIAVRLERQRFTLLLTGTGIQGENFITLLKGVIEISLEVEVAGRLDIKSLVGAHRYFLRARHCLWIDYALHTFGPCYKTTPHDGDDGVWRAEIPVANLTASDIW